MGLIFKLGEELQSLSYLLFFLLYSFATNPPLGAFFASRFIFYFFRSVKQITV
uniref:Uncharacterized protein n=1 Tax=Anguilla anguilla TaxID=7936 RepID=A0A0E9S125_ANGAN